MVTASDVSRQPRGRLGYLRGYFRHVTIYHQRDYESTRSWSSLTGFTSTGAYCQGIWRLHGVINEPSRMMALDNEDDPAAPSQASSDNAPPISAFTVNAENDVLMISNT
jgi:hypothetical protein